MRPLSLVSVLVLVQVLALVGPGWAGHLLVFPGEFSHWLNMRSLVQELQRRGHQISIIVPSASPSVRFNDPELQRRFSFIVFQVPYTAQHYRSFLDSFINFSMYESHTASVVGKVSHVLDFLKHSLVLHYQTCEAIVQNATLMAQLRSAGFDAVLWDPMTLCGDLVAQLLELPLVVSLRFSFGAVFERHCGHAHLPSSYVPSSPLPYSDHMTFGERVTNLLTNLASSALAEILWALTLNGLYSETLGFSTTVCESVGRADLWLIRTFWDLETPKPLPPNFRYVGGLHCRPANPLPEDLEDFVSSAEHGVVVVTFGSMITNLTSDRAEVIATALSNIKQKVIWRYSGAAPRTLGSNTRLLDWIPQNDLLGHPQTRAFVAHGGTNGLYEALYHGVPLVGVPLFGDQSENLARLSRRGVAKVLHFNTMTSQEMSSAIDEVINDPSYGSSMRALSWIHRDRPLAALDEAAFWVEFVLRNKGAGHLRLASHDLSWLQYHSLDVAAFLLVATVTAAIAMATGVKLGLRRLLQRPRAHQD